MTYTVAARLCDYISLMLIFLCSSKFEVNPSPKKVELLQKEFLHVNEPFPLCVNAIEDSVIKLVTKESSSYG